MSIPSQPRPGLRICLDLPPRAFARWSHWLDGHALSEIGGVLDASTLDAVSLSDHPAPPDAWLSLGGHQSLDPFVALGHLAACTSRVRLLTNLIVASYRTALVTAKAASSLDVLSDGRLILGMGAGYVADEFAALDADFHRRGRRFDEAVTKIRASWSGDSFRPGDDAPVSYTVLPRPATPSGPPIWIGGNSAAARRRVAHLGDGWIPFLQTPEQAAVTGTDAIVTLDDLGDLVGELRDLRRDLGLSEHVDVCLSPLRGGDAERFADYLGDQAERCVQAGVTWLIWQPSAQSLSDLMREIGTFSDLARSLDTPVNYS